MQKNTAGATMGREEEALETVEEKERRENIRLVDNIIINIYCYLHSSVSSF